jgi:hypothetical protein
MINQGENQISKSGYFTVVLLFVFIYIFGYFGGTLITAHLMKKTYKDYDIKVEHHNMSTDYNYCPVCGEKLKESDDKDD